MQLCSYTSHGTLRVIHNKKSYVYFSVPDKVTKRLRKLIKAGADGKAFNLLKPYSDPEVVMFLKDELNKLTKG